MSPEITAIVYLLCGVLALLMLFGLIAISASPNTDRDEPEQERIARERLPIPRYSQERRS